MKTRPKRKVKKIAQRINTGTFVKKYGEKTAASLLSLSIGTLVINPIKGNNINAIHGVAIIGASTGTGLFYLSQILPKKLIKEPMIKLMGKQRLAAEISKSIKEPSAKAMLYLIANAHTPQEKQELTLLITGKPSQDNGKTILKLAKKSSIQQNDSLAKKMYVRLRGQRGIPSKIIEPLINRTLKALRTKKITDPVTYTNEIVNNVLPYALNHTMDLYGITNIKTRKRIFEALKKQIKRTTQKHNFGADITPQTLIQDMKMIEYVHEFSQALNEAIPNKKIRTQAFKFLTNDINQLMTYIHGRITLEMFTENLIQRIKSIT